MRAWSDARGVRGGSADDGHRSSDAPGRVESGSSGRLGFDILRRGVGEAGEERAGSARFAGRVCGRVWTGDARSRASLMRRRKSGGRLG